MVENPLAGLQNFFFAGDKADPRVNQQLRQKIALAMMQRQTKYPKTLGEGLSAIGEAIGERGLTNSLLSGDLAEQDAAQKRATELLGGGGAGTPQRTSYAPPSDTGDTTPPPATDAPATPADVQPAPGLTTAPTQPASMLAPGLPTGADTVPDASTLPPGQSAFSFEPRPMTASPPPAQAPAAAAPPGFKPTPNYIRDAIARNVNDPTLRAYLGSLSGSEAKNAQDVSPTGAAGPFQFIPSTAKQYGLTDPTNLDASVIAAKKLTQDNAAAFERINGRPPTAPELALMHQQGGVTGARMVAGTGNAPSGNLAVNNVSPGASPQQAVAAIQKYYGMPNVPVNVRDTIAQTMAQGRPPVPQGMAGAAPIVPAGMSPQGAPPPVMAQGGDQALAFNGQPQQPPLPPAITSGIQKAPPPVQVAQNGPPQPDFGYVTPKPGQTAGAPVIGPGLEEAKLNAAILAAQARGDQYLPALLAPKLQELQTARTQKQNEANEAYKARLLRDNEQARLNLEDTRTQAQRIVEGGQKTEDLTKAQNENRLRAQFGNMPVEDVLKKVNESRAQAKSAADALTASHAAMKAFDKGAITGFGANQKLDVAKLFTGLGLVDKGDRIANTEVFKSAMQPIVASILHQTSGTSQLSEGELAFAKAAAAGNITLDPQSIRQLMTIIDKRSHEVLKDHDTLTGALFDKNNPQTKALYGVETPQDPVKAVGIPEGKTATGPNGRKMVVREGYWEPM